MDRKKEEEYQISDQMERGNLRPIQQNWTFSVRLYEKWYL